MSVELNVVYAPAWSRSECVDLDTNINNLIDRYRNNRHEINRLIFESVAIMTTGEDYEYELANKKGLQNFLGELTGSNKKLQDKINSSRASVQYVSQQILQHLAEQNMMSFDLSISVQNQLHASVKSVEMDINRVYADLYTFFEQVRNEATQIENRITRLERNVDLLNWQNAIEYQTFRGIEYTKLNDISKIVCLVRDFYNITKGVWTTSDLLLLKTAMSTIGISVQKTVSYLEFIKSVAYNGQLMQYLLAGKKIVRLPEIYLVPLLSMKKLHMLDNEEKYIADTALDTFTERNMQITRQYLCEDLMRKYLMQVSKVDIGVQVKCFDLVMELLFNLKEAESIGILEFSGDAADIEGLYGIAAELFKNCQLKEAHPLLMTLAARGCSRANALLYWLLMDGYEGYPPDERTAEYYLMNGYQDGDALCGMLYACYFAKPSEKKGLFRKYKLQLRESAKKKDVFAAYMMRSLYRLIGSEEEKNIIKWLIYDTDEEERGIGVSELIPAFIFDYFKYTMDVVTEGFYKIFYDLVEECEAGYDSKNALLWNVKTMDFIQCMKTTDLTIDDYTNII